MESYSLTLQIKERENDLKTYQGAYQVICEATGLHDINEVARRCYSQEQSGMKLAESATEVNKRLVVSANMLKELEAEVAIARNMGVGRLAQSRKLVEREKEAHAHAQAQIAMVDLRLYAVRVAA